MPHILICPGDGIGPEVMREVQRVAEAADRAHGLHLTFEHANVGGAAIDAEGTPLTDDTLARARNADAVLLGAVGGPAWDGLPFEHKPERALLRLRKELGLFANLRPALVFDPLVEASSLKPELVRGLDILIVRELTGGVYFGEPRGIEDLGGGERRGVNTQVYTSSEVRRVAAVAFDLARQRTGHVTSTEKSNVMESGLLWREEVTVLHQEAHTDVALDHMYADNCAMQLVRRPKQFDVIVTDNLFGDMLSDEAAMLTGSLGMLPSASLGEPGADGRRAAMYEPVHGSAPDIAGRDKANPLATVLSLAMLLRYSLGAHEAARAVEDAVTAVLARGLRTPDLAGEGEAPVGTRAMGDALVAELGAGA